MFKNFPQNFLKYSEKDQFKFFLNFPEISTKSTQNESRI